jgi:hypothetical protein
MAVVALQKSLSRKSFVHLATFDDKLREKTVPEAGLIQLWEVGPEYLSLTIIGKAESHVKLQRDLS